MAGNLIHGADVGHWVAAQTDGAYFSAMSQAIGLVRDGELVAGVIYENWNGKSITCHIAFLGRLSKAFLALAFRYAFITCGAHKIIAPVMSDNTDALRVVRKMGFLEEARIVDGAPRGDIVLFTMTAETCRFLRGAYGQERSGTAAS